MYQTTTYQAEISTEEYIRNYINIPEFLECCKACDNYDIKWSCPPYDFDPMEIWKKYSTLELFATKITFEEELLLRPCGPQEKSLAEEIFWEEKKKLAEMLWEKEMEFPGSVSLSAGSCELCGRGNCAKQQREPCRHENKMRYSIESLGGNVGLTLSRLLNIELEWMEEGKLPKYYVLVSGLLKP